MDTPALIEEYKQDLRLLTKQYQAIIAKKVREPIKKDGKTVYQIVDERTAQEVADQKTIAGAITSTRYALYWLEHGVEKPYDQEQASKIPKHRRAMKLGDIDQTSYQVYLQEMNKPVEEIKFKEEGIKAQLNEIEGALSDKEKLLFHLIHIDLYTYGEAAKEMDLALGTVKSTSQRIKNKLDQYFNDEPLNLLKNNCVR
ncbi:positive control factor [Candidatus Enterococcus courvalinii]|uniref:Positive control factor n=1 Tax=Candidatus Enterococcus courvalinii TaxID=2815329 RepID=A0ABS3HZD8_9ENTE|nr:positive control factor [Enterococcus sp. MSG2901]MBO0481814.1 positive control factor [Enterococcus sp. MSG2901]